MTLTVTLPDATVELIEDWADATGLGRDGLIDTAVWFMVGEMRMAWEEADYQWLQGYFR